jgi:hypothetical protein
MGVCLFSSFLLFRIRYVRYLIAFWWIFCMRVYMAYFGILRFVSLSMDCLCMAPLTPTVMIMRGFVFHPLFSMMLINGTYLVCLCTRACS